MIAYLIGEITHIVENSIYVEVGGIGYEVFMPYDHSGERIRMGQKVKVFVYENIKEDMYDLYGFLTTYERELFKKLIGVNGIGPKSALQMLNMYSVNEIMEIILTQNHKALGKVSGIGPKTASRVILELQDVVGKMMQPNLEMLEKGLPEEAQGSKQEAVEALEALGFGSGDAFKAVQAIYNDSHTTETLIKKALSLLMD